MALTPYESFAEEPLQFPISGKTYTLKPIDIPAGIRLAEIVSGKDKAAKNLAGEALWKLLLGSLWDEMVADGVPLAAATRAGLTALADYQYGREMAEAAWESGADPKALTVYLTSKTGNRATRRSAGTGKATTTKPRAVSNGTTSPKS